MPGIQELVEKYQTLSDEELIDIHLQIEDYSEEAKQALNIVLNYKGGLSGLQGRLAKRIEIENEISRIKNEVAQLIDQGCNTQDIKNKINTCTITSAQLEIIIEETSSKLELDKEDVKIKPRTIIGSMLGGIIGGTIGGIFWGIQLVYSGRIFVIFGLGLVLLSYGTIRLFTKQSTRNWIVVSMTIISVIYSLILGQIIYAVFGYRGY